MSQNVAQWLAEIQSLQRQVGMLQQEREQAYNSVKSWRNLYEGEAKQRQRDAVAHSRKITQLEQTIKSLQGIDNTDLDSDGLDLKSADAQTAQTERLTAEIAAINNTQSTAKLQSQLIATKQQCAQLTQQLKIEKNEHKQTRESLTAALGDAVDLLAKERTTS